MPATRMKAGMILHLHAFRGFAILNIVAIHTTAMTVMFLFPAGTEGSFADDILVVSQTLFHGSTLYFAFISGLLYSVALAGRTWKKFFGSKIANVFMPYALVTLLLTIWILPQPGDPATLGSIYDQGAAQFLITLAKHGVYGTALFPLWYIPVLGCLFLVTPALAALMRIKAGRWLLIGLTILPLFISRVEAMLSWQNVVYFLGAYAAGILIGADYGKWLLWLQRHQKMLVITALVSSGIVLLLFAAKIAAWSPLVPVESAVYIQKLSIAGCALVLFKQFEAQLSARLNLLATYAFAIYFLHTPLVIVLLAVCVPVFWSGGGLATALMWLIAAFGVTLAGSVAITAALRAVFGKKSRMIIGA